MIQYSHVLGAEMPYIKISLELALSVAKEVPPLAGEGGCQWHFGEDGKGLIARPFMSHFEGKKETAGSFPAKYSGAIRTLKRRLKWQAK